MSGNAFKELTLKRVDRKTYAKIKDSLSTVFDCPIESIGSTQFFDDSNYSLQIKNTGDADFAVQIPKERIKEIAKNNDMFLSIKMFGNTLSTVIEIDSSLYHVDLMTSQNTKHEAWIMTGGTPQIKGVMRNILLSFIARKKSEKQSTEVENLKWTIAYPGGIGLKINGSKPEKRDTNPRIILETLCLYDEEADIEITRTFEGLVEYIEWSYDLFEEFKLYAQSQWLYKKQPEVIDAALLFLKENYINYL